MSAPSRSPVKDGSVPVRVLGSRFDIRYDDGAVGAELQRLLAPMLVPPEESTSDSLPARVLTVAAGADRTRVVGQVLAELNGAALAAADCLAVHAGAVCSGGRVVAFPGPSRAGKSTLTAACLQAGLEYVSDEALCLSWRTGAVLDYPRPIALSRWSATALGLTASSTVDETVVTAADLGAAAATGPLALAHVVLVERTDRQAAATLDPAPRGDAVAELLRRSFTHYRDPDRAFTLAHQVLRPARAWRLRLGDPRSAGALIRDLVTQSPCPRTASR